MAPAMPCKTCKKCKHGETRSKTDDFKSKFACILEASESTRLRMGEPLPNHHEDHIAGKGENSLQHYNLVHKFISMPQAMKILAAKAAVDKEWEKLEKFSAWNLTKVIVKNEVIDEARTNGAKVHFASLMDICHLKMLNWKAKHPKIQRSSCTPRWYCKDDSGSYAVFTEQGSSASQMTAAKIMDIISRLPGCDGQAADAVSAYTQVKIEDAHKLLKVPKSECPDIWIRLPRHKWPKSWSSMEDPVVLLERNLYGHPLAGLLWERQFEKILLQHGWEKVSNCECFFVHRQKGLFLSVYVDDKKIGWKETKTLIRCGNYSTKKVDLGELTSFLDHENLECTQKQCEISKDIVDNYRTMFESRISAGGTEKLPYGLMIWKVMRRKNVWSDFLCVSKQDDPTTLQSIYSLHRWPPLQRRRNEICWRIVTSMLSKIFWNVYTWHEMEDLIIDGQWINLRDRLTKWTKACDKRLNRLIFVYFITHVNTQQCCHVGKYCKTMQTGTVSRLRFCGRSWGLTIHFWRNIVHFLGVIHLFQ